MNETILQQIKNLIIKYIRFNKKNEKKYNIVIRFIQDSQNIDEIEKHIEYWEVYPYHSTARDYLYAVINENYDATK